MSIRSGDIRDQSLKLSEIALTNFKGGLTNALDPCRNWCSKKRKNKNSKAQREAARRLMSGWEDNLRG